VTSDNVDRLEMCQHQVKGDEGILPNSTFEVNSILLSSWFFEPLKSAQLSKVKAVDYLDFKLVCGKTRLLQNSTNKSM
jgi:hypothetical protein